VDEYVFASCLEPTFSDIAWRSDYENGDRTAKMISLSGPMCGCHY